MSSKKLARSAGVISAATMLSRLFGLVREQIFAALFGTGAFADAFNVAFRIPNFLRDLFAEGALAQAFIPTFKSEQIENGPDAAFRLANRTAGTLVMIIGFITLLAGVFADDIVSVVGRGYLDTPEKFELTVLLTRVMLPFLAIVSLAAVAMGALNANEKFTAPALAPAMFNIAAITMGVCLYLSGIQSQWVVIGWSIGVLLGGLCQLGVQVPSLWRLGFRPKLLVDPFLNDPAIRRIAKLMLPAVVGLAAVQINILVATSFATSEDGAVSWLQYAFRFMQLPIGVFGVAIATVSTTRYATSAAAKNFSELPQHLVEGLKLVFFLTVPATVGLVLLGQPILSLVYEHGHFLPSDTEATTAALQWYATGLVAYASVKVLAPVFYALNKTRIPVIASISAVVANLALSITLHPIYGYRILALGTAIAAIVNVIILYGSASRLLGSVDHRALFLSLAKVAIASILMGASVWLVHGQLENVLAHQNIFSRVIKALVPVGVGVIAYAIACVLLRVDELQFVARFIKKKRNG